MGRRIPPAHRARASAGALTLAEHARIIDAIASGKPEQAERVVREHLTRANAFFRQLNGMPATAPAPAAT